MTPSKPDPSVRRGTVPVVAARHLMISSGSPISAMTFPARSSLSSRFGMLSEAAIGVVAVTHRDAAVLTKIENPRLPPKRSPS